MVIGLDIFKEHFKDFDNCYVIIGGTACDIILEDVGFNPRATDDIDIILIIEALTPEFTKMFWQFIHDGGYKTQQIEIEKKQSYRFAKPIQANFPKQIELFCRVPDAIDLKDTLHLTPIPLGEGLSSLSAILLNEEYYRFTIDNSTLQNGVHFALPHTLVCLKAFAYLNNKERKEAGQTVRTIDINKHKYDVFRLVFIMNPNANITIPESIQVDLQKFANDIKNNLPNSDIFKENGYGNQNMQTVFEQFVKLFNIKLL